MLFLDVFTSKLVILYEIGRTLLFFIRVYVTMASPKILFGECLMFDRNSSLVEDFDDHSHAQSLVCVLKFTLTDPPSKWPKSRHSNPLKG